MVGIDQPIEVDGVYTTIRTLAAEGRITRWHSLSFNAPGATEPYEGWFADCVADGTEWWEISEADFDELAGLGVPMKQSR